MTEKQVENPVPCQLVLKKFGLINQQACVYGANFFFVPQPLSIKKTTLEKELLLWQTLGSIDLILTVSR